MYFIDEHLYLPLFNLIISNKIDWLDSTYQK